MTPVLLLGKTWKQNGPVLLSARLQVQSETEKEATLLQLEDVPYEIVPRVDLTFYREKTELLQLREIPLTRDC